VFPFESILATALVLVHQIFASASILTHNVLARISGTFGSIWKFRKGVGYCVGFVLTSTVAPSHFSALPWLEVPVLVTPILRHHVTIIGFP